MADDEIRRVVHRAAEDAPAAPGLAASVVRGARRRQRQRQSLVVVGAVIALSGTTVAVVDRQNRPDRLTFAQGADVLYTCGGIGPSFPADAVRNPLGAENADDPATAVLRAHTTPANSPYVQSNGWRELARTEDEVIWTTGPEFGYYGVRHSGDMWKFAHSGGMCRFTRVLPDSFRPSPWTVAAQPDPEASSIDVRIKHSKRDGRPNASPIVELRPHAVSITMALQRPEPDDRQPASLVYREDDFETATYSVDLGEPIGDRQLLDGASFPAVPVSTTDQKETSCGLYPLHLDNLEIRAAAPTRFWPADFCPAGEQRFSLLTEGRHAETPLPAVPAGARRSNGRTPHVVTIPAVSPGPAAIIARGSACGFCVVGYTPAFVLEAPQPEPSGPPQRTPTCRPERLELSQKRVRAGDTVRVSSKPAQCMPYAEGTTYRAVLLFVGRADPVVLGDVPVGRDGSFSVDLDIPTSASPGEAAIKMEGSALDGGCDASALASCASYLVPFEILAPG